MTALSFHRGSIISDEASYIFEVLRELPWASSIKALKAALGMKVRKVRFKPSNRTLHLVSGVTGDHLVTDWYCSCLDFYVRVLVREERNYCYHIAAKKIAEKLNLIIENKVTDRKYPEIILKVARDDNIL